ncbi:MAG: InlB B-repeat-containing protein [Bacteroidales bacterium]|nr:InlB B-repeat-containing protein [Bacteroidales bacterium]
MKKVLYLLIALLSGISTMQAQTTEGQDFWLTFGSNGGQPSSDLDLQIRIVSGNLPTTGTIYFTNLGTYKDFEINAQEVYTYSLNNEQRQAVYNNFYYETTVTDYSIHITSAEPVTVYALNQVIASVDATNILPVTALSTEYYQISYAPPQMNPIYHDAYAVVATQNNTGLYHNGLLETTLDAGQVYYRNASPNMDMTGSQITADNPVALFAVNPILSIPLTEPSYASCLMQQLAPVNTWGKNFFVPVSHCAHDIVRIVASQNNTDITQTGGVIRTGVPDAQTTLTGLQAGEFVELDIALDDNGCHIQADKPVGVCSYLTNGTYYGMGYISAPAQCWIPAIEQSVGSALIAPFIPEGWIQLNDHCVIVVTPAATKENTKVSIGGAPPTDLSGGSWVDNIEAGMSFYIMPLTDATASYHFTNQEGLITYCYGIGYASSYYYPAYSAMRNLTAGFYANDIHCQSLDGEVFCEPEVDFRAEIDALGVEIESLHWYIDGTEYLPAQNQETWSKTFAVGNYLITLEVYPDDGGAPTIIEGDLHIGADISATPLPPLGGVVTGSDCYKADETVNLTATPNPGYAFSNWTENGTPVETNTTYSFTATKSRTLVANFTPLYDIIVIPSPAVGDNDATGGGSYPHGTPVIVTAIADTCYIFVNWTKDGEVVSNNPIYLFIAVEPCTLIANFIPKQYVILTEEDPDEGGETYGGGNHDCGTDVTVTAVPAYGYDFVNWTEDDDEVANTPDYTFIAAEHRLLTAHFEPKIYDIELLVNPPLPLVAGDVFGAGSYPYGENITVSAVAEPCYFFVNWTEDNVEVSKNADYTFTVTKDRILVANFDRFSYDVVVLPSPTGGGTVGGGGSHLCGDTIPIWAVPNDCYDFVDWTENGVSLSTDPYYDLIVTGHHVLYANFALKTFEVEVLPNPDPNGGTVTINSADGIFDCGETAIVKAYANNGYHFINWTKDNVHQSYAAFYQFEVTESCTMVANFEQEFYKITVEANPPEGGNVLGNGTYAYDDPATVSAIANGCWEFVDWTEDGVWASDDADYDFTVTKSRHLVANFVRITHDIIALVDPEEGGTVTGGGIYNECETATLKATANPCYDFVNWTEDGNEVGVNPVFSFVVTEPRTLVANFEQRYYNVVVSAKPEEYGEVSGGDENLPCGEEITVTATAYECYEFVNWTENGKFVSDENPYIFELTKDRDLVANFKVKICNVVLSANPGIGGSVSGGANGITCNTDIIVTATPAECYIFVNWTEDGEWVSDDAEYEFTVLDSHNLVANFELETLTIKLLSNPLNSGILSGDGDHLCGDAITVTAEPVNDCYTFLNWTEDDEEVATTSSYTFTVMESRTLTANFEQQTRNLALYANPPDGGTVIGSGDHPCGEEVTAKAIPESGYVFINWTEYGDEISTDDEFTFIIMSPRILVANFALEAYQIITIANPTEGGTTTGDGMYHLDDFVTVKAIPEPTYKFINWTEDDAPVSNDAEYSFTVTESRTLVANFDILLYNVIAEISDGNYGYTTGSGMYAAGDTARVEVFVDDCYRFSNWTIEDKEVSKSKIYEFEVTDDVTVTANFNVLDFDTYAPTLWNNTFMLNLRRLETEGYAVTGCQWYKNGDEEEETRTINEFSYSAGPAITDLLEPAPTWYMFRLITSNRGDLCSTHKTLTGYTSPPGTDEKLFIYPNPVISGNSFTVEGASEGCSVLVYNQYGICVRSVIATQNPVTITLDNVQPGSYLIRADGKQGKVVIIN